MADQQFFQWLTMASLAAIGIIVSVLLVMLKNAKESGTTEGMTKGRVDLNENLATNAIKELEKLKIEWARLCQEVQAGRIDIARIEERIKFIQERVSAVQERVDTIQGSLNDFITNARNRNLNDDARNLRDDARQRRDDQRYDDRNK